MTKETNTSKLEQKTVIEQNLPGSLISSIVNQLGPDEEDTDGDKGSIDGGM